MTRLGIALSTDGRIRKKDAPSAAPFKADMGIIEAISQGFRATAEFFGWKREKDARENAPDVRQAEIGHDQAELKKKITDELEDEDLPATRRRNSE